MHQHHEAMEALQVLLQELLGERPALGILQGLQLEESGVGAEAFQLVSQVPPQRRVALVPHVVGIAEVGEVEHVEALQAWGHNIGGSGS